MTLGGLAPQAQGVTVEGLLLRGVLEKQLFEQPSLLRLLLSRQMTGSKDCVTGNFQSEMRDGKAVSSLACLVLPCLNSVSKKPFFEVHRWEVTLGMEGFAQLLASEVSYDVF